MGGTMIGMALMGITVGTGFALQSVLNTRLARHIGLVEANLVSVTVTWALLCAIFLARLGQTKIGALGSVPPYLFIGGAFAVFALLVIVYLVPRIGVGPTLSAVIVGQLFASVLLDHFGVLGLTKIALTPLRAGGLALMVVGLRLVFVR